MKFTPKFLIALVGFYLIWVGGTVANIETHGHLGFSNSGFARLFSNFVFNEAETAHHGGGKDTSERGSGWLCKLDEAKFNDMAKRLYLGREFTSIYEKKTEGLVKHAFNADPGNWAAFFSYYNYLTEGRLAADIGPSEAEDEELDEREEILKKTRNAIHITAEKKTEIDEACRAYTQNTSLIYPKDYYRLAAVIFFTYQNSPEKFGSDRIDRLNKLKHIVWGLVESGNLCKEQESEVEKQKKVEAEAFAKALLFYINRSLNNAQSKNTQNSAT